MFVYYFGGLGLFGSLIVIVVFIWLLIQWFSAPSTNSKNDVATSDHIVKSCVNSAVAASKEKKQKQHGNRNETGKDAGAVDIDTTLR